MAYFDSKEEVLDLQLTQYGKIMLQKGRFRPHYYCFFDDEILYDSKYGLHEEDVPESYVEESQRDILDRIKETPRTKTQHIYYGAETSVDARNLEYDFGRPYYNPKWGRMTTMHRDTFYEDFRFEPNPTERNKALGFKIHSGPIGLDKSPVIVLKTQKAQLEADKIQYLTQSVSGLPIPQISASVITKLVQEQAPMLTVDPSVTKMLRTQNLFSSQYRTLDRKINIDTPSLYLELSEQNSFYKDKNYDLEVFYVRQRVTDPGSRPKFIIFFDRSNMPTNGQYFVVTGSSGLTAAFEVGVSDENGAYVGDFENNEQCPKYRVINVEDPQEFVNNFVEAFLNHENIPFRQTVLSDYFTAVNTFEPGSPLAVAFTAIEISKKSETTVRVNFDHERLHGAQSRDNPLQKRFTNHRAPIIEEYLVPLRFDTGATMPTRDRWDDMSTPRLDRWNVDFNFDIQEDENIPITYPKYFDMHTKMSIFAARHERESRPLTNISDMYEGSSFDPEINDCEE